MASFAFVDYVVMVLYVAGIAWLGASFGKGQDSTEDYFLGGRSVPWWAIGLSVMATQASAITFIGAPGWGYEGGLQRTAMFLNVPLVMAFLIVTLVPFFYRAEVYTAYEYLERRFDTKTRTLTAALFLVSRGLATGVVLYAPALVLSVVTGLPIWLTITLMAVIAVAYTVLGGISAVIWTDVVQMFILWFGAALSIWIVLDGLPDGTSVIGIASDNGLLDSLDFSLDLTETYGIWAGIVGGFFLHAAYFGCDQSQIQRVLTSSSTRNSNLSLMVSGFLMFPQILLFLSIGILLFVFYDVQGRQPDLENLNELFPRFIVNELPVGISGLIIAGVFAAAMSSLDSALNSLSAVSIRDFYAKFYRRNASEAHYLKASRWATVFWGLYATAFAFFAGNLGPVIEVINMVGSYFYGALLGVFFLAIFSRRATGTGAFVGIVAGMAAVYTLTSTTEVAWLWNNLVGAVVSVGVGQAISMLGSPPADEQLKGLTLAYSDVSVQSELAGLSDEATPVDEAGPTGGGRTGPFWLIGYFLLTLIVLAAIQSL